MGGILFTKYRDKLFEDKDLKKTENRILGPRYRHLAPRALKNAQGMNMASHAPRTFTMCLGNSFFLTLMRLGHFLCALCMQKCEVQLSFPASVFEKAHTFSPNSGRNSHYKYHPSSFRISRLELWQFKRKESLKLRESFYLLLDFLRNFFIFSNLFLVTMCN